MMDDQNCGGDETLSCTCPICLGPLSQPCRTPCKHIFCKQCIALVLFSSSSREHCPSCRGFISGYVITEISSGNTLLPTPKIIGSVYNQNRIPGLAAYHFESEENCYISYASPGCSLWPDLDNGERPPVKKPFTNVSINEDERVFKGDIIWAPTSWRGNVVWSYEMHFSEDYQTIPGGRCVQYADLNMTTPTETVNFGEQLIYFRCLIHDHLMLIPNLKIVGGVYIQESTLGLASYHFESEENCYISYASPQCENWPALDNGERPPVNKQFTNVSINEEERIFQGDIVWAPTSWQGEVLWRYEMCFSDDYGTIIGGKVEAFDALDGGSVLDTDLFGRDLIYKRHIADNLYQMIQSMDHSLFSTLDVGLHNHLLDAVWFTTGRYGLSLPRLTGLINCAALRLVGPDKSQ